MSAPETENGGIKLNKIENNNDIRNDDMGIPMVYLHGENIDDKPQQLYVNEFDYDENKDNDVEFSFSQHQQEINDDNKAISTSSLSIFLPSPHYPKNSININNNHNNNNIKYNNNKMNQNSNNNNNNNTLNINIHNIDISNNNGNSNINNNNNSNNEYSYLEDKFQLKRPISLQIQNSTTQMTPTPSPNNSVGNIPTSNADEELYFIHGNTMGHAILHPYAPDADEDRYNPSIFSPNDPYNPDNLKPKRNSNNNTNQLPYNYSISDAILVPNNNNNKRNNKINRFDDEQSSPTISFSNKSISTSTQSVNQSVFAFTDAITNININNNHNNSNINNNDNSESKKNVHKRRKVSKPQSLSLYNINRQPQLLVPKTQNSISFISDNNSNHAGSNSYQNLNDLHDLNVRTLQSLKQKHKNLGLRIQTATSIPIKNKTQNDKITWKSHVHNIEFKQGNRYHTLYQKFNKIFEGEFARIYTTKRKANTERGTVALKVFQVCWYIYYIYIMYICI